MRDLNPVILLRILPAPKFTCSEFPCPVRLAAVELFEPIQTAHGTVHSEDSHTCSTAPSDNEERERSEKWPTGDRFFAMPEELAPSCLDVEQRLQAGDPVAFASCRALLPPAAKWGARILVATVMLFGLIVCCWIPCVRHHPVLVANQPGYLFVTIFGAVITMSAVLASTIDLGGQHANVEHPSGGRFPELDTAVDAKQPLVFVGFTMTNAALIARVLQAHQVFERVASRQLFITSHRHHRGYPDLGLEPQTSYR